MRRAAALLVAAFAALPSTADARDLWTSKDGTKKVRLESALKASWLLSHAPPDPLLAPEPDSAATLWRLRLEPHAEFNDWLHLDFAYEHRSRLATGTGGLGLGGGILPSDAVPPWRIWAGDWKLVDLSPTFTHRHEIDRAFVSIRHPRGTFTIGRQAIGWGRGVLFGAVDLFAPFSPLEVDREWRRGVDAFRGEVELHERLSLDVVAVLGAKLDTDKSAFVGRLRGYLGDFDGEVIFGRRARDWVWGASASAKVKDAEVHGEAALFATPGDGIDGGLFGTKGVVLKAVLGASYLFPIGTGLIVFAEYHYSGFGLRDVPEATSRLLDPSFGPAFGARLLRGDTQILGRHALAFVASYTVADAWAFSLTWIQSPADGSGLFTHGVTWTVSDAVTLAASVFLPYGEKPASGMLRSEYGASPISAFVQLRVYD